MHVHINHCWCRDSNWGGVYNCRYMVAIQNQSFCDPYNPKAESEKDWTDLLVEFRMLDQERFDWLKERYKDWSEEQLRECSQTTSRRLVPEVFKWLEDNVADSKEHGHEGEKGWCVGTDSYNQNSYEGFTIFFYRRSDALKFIKTWSTHKQPTTYFDYFKEIRKELDPKTRKLRVVEEFTRT